MINNTVIFLGVFTAFSCSTMNEERNPQGHWHCIKTGQCDFATVDITDSTLIANKYIVCSYVMEMYLDKNKVAYDEDVEVDLNEGELFVKYSGGTTQYVRSDLRNCILNDRYLNSMIDLSLPEVQSAKPYDISTKDFITGNILIGKLKPGFSDLNDKLSKQYPDSIFIQVNDVLISYNDIPKYVQELKSCNDCPKTNINLHIDKEVREEVVGTVFSLINPENYRSTSIHNVVKIANGDIGLLKR